MRSSSCDCKSNNISLDCWLMNLHVSHFYFLFFMLEFDTLGNFLRGTYFQCHLLEAEVNPMFIHFTHQNIVLFD